MRETGPTRGRRQLDARQAGYPRGRSGGYAREPRQDMRSRAVQGGYQKSPPQDGHSRAPGISLAGMRIPLPALRIGTVLLLAAVTVAVVVGLINNANNRIPDPNKITSGVKIDGHDVSGMDVGKLENQLKAQYKKKIDSVSVKITYNGQVLQTLNGQDIGITDNVGEVVGQAVMLAHSGSVENDRAEARKVRAEGREFDVALSISPSALKIKLTEIANSVSKQGADATVQFNPDNVTFQIPQNIEDLKPRQEEIDKMFIVNPEVNGQIVDVEQMAQKITEDLKDDWKAEQELVVNPFVPQMTAEKLRQSFRLLNAFRTQLGSSNTPERISNIDLALKNFNGMVVKPGQEVSFNDTTGPRTEAAGYKPAPTIGADKSLVDDFGGGVCQASTTLYNSVLMSGCEVLKRSHHSIPSSYVLKGFDAMVNYPGTDFVFKNAGDTPIYIKAYVKKRWVYVMVFGKPLPDGMTIKRGSEILYQGPEPKMETKVDKDGKYIDHVRYQDDDPYVVIQGHKELTIQAYLIYYDSKGKEIERKNLYQDRFKEIDGVQYVGKEVRKSDSSQSASSGDDGTLG